MQDGGYTLDILRIMNILDQIKVIHHNQSYFAWWDH